MAVKRNYLNMMESHLIMDWLKKREADISSANGLKPEFWHEACANELGLTGRLTFPQFKKRAMLVGVKLPKVSRPVGNKRLRGAPSGVKISQWLHDFMVETGYEPPEEMMKYLHQFDRSQETGVLH